MLPASNRGTGMNAGFPDTCNTPQPSGTVPIPYPNIASASSASTFASTVYVGMVNALNLNSSIPNTSGDEAGTAQPNMGKAGYTAGNPIVYVEKVPAINLVCPTNGNNYNCSLAAVVVPAVSVVSFTQAGLEAPGRDDLVRSAVCVERTAEGSVHVSVSLVTTDIGRDLRAALDRLGLERPARVRIDVRGCRGGDLEGALDLASRFTPSGEVLAVIEDTEGDREERRSTGGPWEGIPVEVEGDRFTASAAEGLATALRDGASARIIGERTYGKGRVEALREGALTTVGQALTREGSPIEGRGVTPDEPAARGT